jgi:hypothetical protein
MAKNIADGSELLDLWSIPNYYIITI